MPFHKDGAEAIGMLCSECSAASMPLPQDQGGMEQCPSPGKLETMRKQKKCFPNTWLLQQEFEVMVTSCTAALGRAWRQEKPGNTIGNLRRLICSAPSSWLRLCRAGGSPDETAFPTIRHCSRALAFHLHLGGLDAVSLAAKQALGPWEGLDEGPQT